MTRVLVDGLVVGYSAADTVLNGLMLDAPSGQITAVLGASGSGKTTLLRTLAGFLRPTRGTVAFGDRVVAGPGPWVPPESRRVGIVPQEGALFPHLDVAGNVAFGLRGVPDARARVQEVLSIVGMSGSERRRPHELSGGQAQRIALARALAPKPDVVLLDEPFSALDAGMRTRIAEEVCGVLAELRTTAILVTHDQQEALGLAHLVAYIDAGKVVQAASPWELYNEPVDLSTARFVGDVVELPAHRADAAGVDCAFGYVSVTNPSDIPSKGVLVLRPEQIELRAADGQHVTGLARVVSVRYRGHDSMIQLELADGSPVVAQVSGQQRHATGDEVVLTVRGAGRVFAS
ncbi:MAG: ABC transporter ATP-binding protein [Actinomycetota bacterium]|nr:ABC transporter ATP-binding protein [Actinomycetota bacterium]